MSRTDDRKDTQNGRLQMRPSPRAAREEVDAIFEQWRRERPDIEPEPVWIYGLLGRAHLRATALIDEVLEPLKLVRGTFDVLTALRRAGVPYSLTPKELAKSLLLSGAGLNSRLNKLEALHLIARLPEPADRRSVRIQLTTLGESVINQAIPRVFEVQWKPLTAMGEESYRSLAAELGRFTDALDSCSSS